MYSKQSIQFLGLLFVLFLGTACQSNKEGAIEGTIIPATVPVRISAVRDGKDLHSASSGTQDGKFRLSLPAGTYVISMLSASSPYPLRLNGVVVLQGKTTTLDPVDLKRSCGTSTVCGQISPPRPSTEVKLMQEGQERAAVQTDKEGKYEFKEIPAGTYVVQANAEGHAADSVQVSVSDNQKIEQNALLLPIVQIDGVDWTAGKIRATGIGVPPPNSANETVRREMTKRAALSSAQRNLLATIERIQIDEKTSVKTAMLKPATARKLEGFIKGYAVVSERILDDGRVEVILELPLNGPSGLSRYIAE